MGVRAVAAVGDGDRIGGEAGGEIGGAGIAVAQDDDGGRHGENGLQRVGERFAFVFHRHRRLVEMDDLGAEHLRGGGESGVGAGAGFEKDIGDEPPGEWAIGARARKIIGAIENLLGDGGGHIAQC